MTRSSSRVIGVALAAALMATGSAAMAQMYSSGTTTGNPNTNAGLLNRHSAPAMTPPPVTYSAPAYGGTTVYEDGAGYGSGTYRAPDGSMANSAVSTGNYAKGGTSTGTGQTQMPGDPPTGTLGSGAGGR